ncbi:MBL fold metallo-hydrolase [Sporosarcina jiandibaonis]|uniref:MBL fold metallo-hydrolase n=1 Tax=Sporosarcina jiandibaonis TaxID=2715535 RepID=UPI0015545674|nr:MBL fold metallo-hydrolase [Sporosarcina jiandibaonis]
MYKVTTYPLGPIQTNCYIIQDEIKNCLLIDPGEEGLRLVSEIKKNELNPWAIMLTHGHFDHIGAVDVVRDEFNIPVYIHEIEKDTLTNPEQNGSTRYPGLPLVKNKEADFLLTDEGVKDIGPFTFEVLHTPGHSPGSVTYVFSDDRFAIVGDTLFNQGVGRTDLPGGNTEILLSSIHNKLLTLGDDFIIYPGHGSPTTPSHEMEMNPFLNGF